MRRFVLFVAVLPVVAFAFAGCASILGIDENYRERDGEAADVATTPDAALVDHLAIVGSSDASSDGSIAITAHDATPSDVAISTFNLGPNVDGVSSIDIVEGRIVYATSVDWTLFVSSDVGVTWAETSFVGDASYRPNQARVYVNRANEDNVLLYAYAASGGTNNPMVVDSHTAFTSNMPSTPNQTGSSSYGTIAAFSGVDPSTVIFFGDTAGSTISTDYGDTSTAVMTPSLVTAGYWAGVAAAIDPLDSNTAWLTVAPSVPDGGPTLFAQYDVMMNTFTNLTDLASARLGGQAPCGFEVYTDSIGHNLRVIGDQGAVATSVDEAASFITISSAVSLPSCARFAGGARQLTSASFDRARVVSWCPGVPDVSYSTDSGQSWSTLASADWVSHGCGVTGVVIGAAPADAGGASAKALVACSGQTGVAFSF